MAIPVVTCGAKIVVAWGEGAGFYNAYFSATATGSPTSWRWTILSVPAGLEALLSGSWGDFAGGVATMQGPALTGVPTTITGGTIVVQCVATNGDGPSDPTVDRAAGQQCLVIKTLTFDLPIPRDREYHWGQGQLHEVLTKLEAAPRLASFQRATTPLSSLVLATGNDTWFNVTGLTLNVVTTVPNTVFMFRFEGSAARAAGACVIFVRFAVNGVPLIAGLREQSFSAAANTALPVGHSRPHTIPLPGTHTVTVQIKYWGNYGPSTLWDGTFTVIRFR